ncbi:hypothetical protein ABV792_RS24615 [Escherichia coli]|uniref:hypothetical protein n=1 Tax=Escherichia coli TaxID=562 RepID=UPI0019C20F95|nr:hypothetical protein [Escherichia coli]EJD4606502.1 hypothetical protein [Escherichia coli]MCH4655656.1 hypothetical protein [Escherichia coli]MCI4524080.1 hypothetical protein [Escherichia coli]MDN0724676.1 hypothetical protein [Escherichia coli]MDN0772260.1 hypothetical protein [Escherichia coli]
MKAKYLVTIDADDEQYEFETVIERGDKISDEELIAILTPEALQYLDSIKKSALSGERRGFTKLYYNFLDIIE